MNVAGGNDLGTPPAASLFRWWPLIPLGSIALISLGVLAARDASWLQEPLLFSGLALLMGACCLIALACVRVRPPGRLGLAWILGVGVALQVVACGLYQSDDVNRYLVEGRQILAGQNPFAIAPADPRASALVPPQVAAEVNHPHMTAIYPPVTLAVQAAVAAVSPDLPGHAAKAGFRVAGVLGALAVIALALALLLRFGQPPAHIVIVAWNPVLAIFGSGESHNDLILCVLLLAAVLAASSVRHRLAAGLTALACLAKPFAVVALLPVLYAGRWRGWWLLPVLPVLAFLPFAAAGSGLAASFLTFGGDRHFHGVLDPGLRWALRAILAPEYVEPAVRLGLGLALVATLTLVWRWRAQATLPTTVAWSLAMLLICLPTLHPWYFLVLVALLPFTRSWALALWTASAGLYWLHGIRMAQVGGWTETPWVTVLAHWPAMVLLAVEGVRCRRSCALPAAGSPGAAHG